MVLKNVGIAIICTTLLAWGSVSLADEYRPDEFLRLDLSKALLSPKPLGPASKFAPVAVEAKTDRRSEDAQARADSTADSKIVKTKRIVTPSTRVAHIQAEKPRVHAQKPRGVVRTRRSRGYNKARLARSPDVARKSAPAPSAAHLACAPHGVC